MSRRTIFPTLSADRAAEGVWDVLVVGAGPAGAMAAHTLARAGHPVLLVDKAAFPRPKVCGCCVNAAALGVLKAAGLGDLVRREGGRPVDRLRLRAGGRLADVPLPPGAALSRHALDAALIRRAIDRGADFLPRTAAKLGPIDPAFRTVDLTVDRRTITARARVVLAADGLAGRLLDGIPGFETIIRPDARIGASALLEEGAPPVRLPPVGSHDAHAGEDRRDGSATPVGGGGGGGASDSSPGSPYPAGTIHMACGSGGYVGLVRLEDGRLDAAAAFDPAYIRRRGGPAGAAADTLRQAGAPPLDPTDAHDDAPRCEASGPGLETNSERSAVSRRTGVSKRTGVSERAATVRERGASVVRDRFRALAARTGPALPAPPGASGPGPLAGARWRGTPRLTRRRRRIAGERLLVIGDAAGYVEPFTGEGIAWALASGRAAGRLIAEGAGPSCPAPLTEAWPREHRRLLRRRQRSCGRITRLLRRPRLTRLAVALLGRCPRLAASVVRNVNETPLR